RAAIAPKRPGRVGTYRAGTRVAARPTPPRESRHAASRTAPSIRSRLVGRCRVPADAAAGARLRAARAVLRGALAARLRPEPGAVLLVRVPAGAPRDLGAAVWIVPLAAVAVAVGGAEPGAAVRALAHLVGGDVR